MDGASPTRLPIVSIQDGASSVPLSSFRVGERPKPLDASPPVGIQRSLPMPQATATKIRDSASEGWCIGER